MFQVIASGFGFAVLKVGSTLLTTMIATQGVRRTSRTEGLAQTCRAILHCRTDHRGLKLGVPSSEEVGSASSSWSPTFVLLHSHLLRHTSRLHPRPDLFPTVRLAHFATKPTVTTSVTQRFASSCCHARPSCLHCCFSDAQPHFRGVSAISLCHAACRRQATQCSRRPTPPLSL